MIPYVVCYNADEVVQREIVFARSSEDAGRKIIKKAMKGGCKRCFIVSTRIARRDDFE